MENRELQKFYIDIREEINSTLVTEEEGTNPEQIFTELALSYLSEAGETENYRVCLMKKLVKEVLNIKSTATLYMKITKHLICLLQFTMVIPPFKVLQRVMQTKPLKGL